MDCRPGALTGRLFQWAVRGPANGSRGQGCPRSQPGWAMDRWNAPVVWRVAAPGRFQIGDTAECNSALRTDLAGRIRRLAPLLGGVRGGLFPQKIFASCAVYWNGSFSSSPHYA